jgi:hypothetical protein
MLRLTLLAAMLLPGCTPTSAPPPSTSDRSAQQTGAPQGAPDPNAPGATPIAASAAPDRAPADDNVAPLPPIVVIMYQLELPYASISRNEDFWKLIEEDVTDVPTQNRLALNGLRFGRAHATDWPKFRALLDLKTASLLSNTVFRGPPGIYDRPFDMTATLPDELLEIFDEHGLTLRSYTDCINRFSFAFQWVPRKPGNLRVDLCPVVHAWRLRTDYTVADVGRVGHFLQRDNFYPLHASANVPPGDFLVVGTSTATDDPNRIGSRFLTRQGPTQRYEQVLILLTKEMSLIHVRKPMNPDARSLVGEPVEPQE